MNIELILVMLCSSIFDCIDRDGAFVGKVSFKEDSMYLNDNYLGSCLISVVKGAYYFECIAIEPGENWNNLIVRYKVADKVSTLRFNGIDRSWNKPIMLIQA